MLFFCIYLHLKTQFDQQGTWARAEHHLVAITTALSQQESSQGHKVLQDFSSPPSPGCQSLSFFLFFFFFSPLSSTRSSKWRGPGDAHMPVAPWITEDHSASFILFSFGGRAGFFCHQLPWPYRSGTSKAIPNSSSWSVWSLGAAKEPRIPGILAGVVSELGPAAGR